MCILLGFQKWGGGEAGQEEGDLTLQLHPLQGPGEVPSPQWEILSSDFHSLNLFPVSQRQRSVLSLKVTLNHKTQTLSLPEKETEVVLLIYQDHTAETVAEGPSQAF